MIDYIMKIEKRNTQFGEQVTLIAEEGKILVNGNTQARVVYIGKGNTILDWQEIEEVAGENISSEEFESIPNQEEIKKYLIDGVQNYMDRIAQTRGYDSILSACSYINTGVDRFDIEGEQARKWRSQVWAYCYEYLDEVLAGKREIPTLESLIQEIPKINWLTE